MVYLFLMAGVTSVFSCLYCLNSSKSFRFLDTLSQVCFSAQCWQLTHLSSTDIFFISNCICLLLKALIKKNIIILGTT